MGNTNFESHKAELLQNPEFRRKYEALEPKYNLIRTFIHRRNELRLSQVQLASIIGMQQPAISRLERGDGKITINTLRRVADALNADLDISLKPRSPTKVASTQPNR